MICRSLRTVPFFALPLLAGHSQAQTTLVAQDFNTAAGTVAATSGSAPFLTAPRQVNGIPVSSGQTLSLRLNSQLRDVYYQSPVFSPAGTTVLLEFTFDGATVYASPLPYENGWVMLSSDGGSTFPVIIPSGNVTLTSAPVSGFPATGVGTKYQYQTLRLRLDLSPSITAGGSYAVRVGAGACNGIQNFGVAPGLNLDDLLITEQPGVPTSLMGIGGNTTATFSFTSAQGAAAYRIYRSPDGITQTLIANNWPLTTFEDTHLLPNASYFYSVAAISQGGVATARSGQLLLSTSGPGPMPDSIRTLQVIRQNPNSVHAFGPAMTTGNGSGFIDCSSYTWDVWNSVTKSFSAYTATPSDDLYLSPLAPGDANGLLAISVRAQQGATIGAP